MNSSRQFKVLIIFSRVDDKLGHLTLLGNDLKVSITQNIGFKLGEEVSIFTLDEIAGILLNCSELLDDGSNPSDTQHEFLKDCDIALLILTPSFFNCSICESSLKLFLDKKKGKNREDFLLIPIRYLDYGSLEGLNIGESEAFREIFIRHFHHEIYDGESLRASYLSNSIARNEEVNKLSVFINGRIKFLAELKYEHLAQENLEELYFSSGIMPDTTVAENIRKSLNLSEKDKLERVYLDRLGRETKNRIVKEVIDIKNAERESSLKNLFACLKNEFLPNAIFPLESNTALIKEINAAALSLGLTPKDTRVEEYKSLLLRESLAITEKKKEEFKEKCLDESGDNILSAIWAFYFGEKINKFQNELRLSNKIAYTIRLQCLFDVSKSQINTFLEIAVSILSAAYARIKVFLPQVMNWINDIALPCSNYLLREVHSRIHALYNYLADKIRRIDWSTFRSNARGAIQFFFQIIKYIIIPLFLLGSGLFLIRVAYSQYIVKRNPISVFSYHLKNTFSYRGNTHSITSPAELMAIGLLSRWLNSLDRIFGPEHDQILAETLTTGVYRSIVIDILQERRSFEQYLLYKKKAIESIDGYEFSPTRISISATLIEDRVLIESDGSSKYQTCVHFDAKYMFDFVESTWKLSNVHYLQSRNCD